MVIAPGACLVDSWKSCQDRTRMLGSCSWGESYLKLGRILSWSFAEECGPYPGLPAVTYCLEGVGGAPCMGRWGKRAQKATPPCKSRSGRAGSPLLTVDSLVRSLWHSHRKCQGFNSGGVKQQVIWSLIMVYHAGG